jgi:hypothetical protein
MADAIDILDDAMLAHVAQYLLFDVIVAPLRASCARGRVCVGARSTANAIMVHGARLRSRDVVAMAIASGERNASEPGVGCAGVELLAAESVYSHWIEGCEIAIARGDALPLFVLEQSLEARWEDGTRLAIARANNEIARGEIDHEFAFEALMRAVDNAIYARWRRGLELIVDWHRAREIIIANWYRAPEGGSVSSESTSRGSVISYYDLARMIIEHSVRRHWIDGCKCAHALRAMEARGVSRAQHEADIRADCLEIIESACAVYQRDLARVARDGRESVAVIMIDPYIDLAREWSRECGLGDRWLSESARAQI